MITKINRTGYPQNMQEPVGSFDALGDEVLEGDDIVIDGVEIILKENLEKYLSMFYGFKFQTAK